MYGGSSRDAIAAFKQVLDRAGIPATVRLTRGGHRGRVRAAGREALTAEIIAWEDAGRGESRLGAAATSRVDGFQPSGGSGGPRLIWP
jgi:hypothetical protein